MKITITGSNSGLGLALNQALSGHQLTRLSRQELDLANINNVLEYELDYCDILINCAATDKGGKITFVNLNTARKTINFSDSFHQVFREKLSLKTRTLQDVLNDDVWAKLFNSFDSHSKAWVECEQKCSNQLVTEDYAVGYLTN